MPGVIDPLALALAMEGVIHIATGTSGVAWFGGDMLHRYGLQRTAGGLAGVGTCAFVMLNPSKADHNRNDPTVKRTIGYATAWGYRDLLVANAFAWRATDPDELLPLTAAQAIGASNDRAIAAIASLADLVVCGWGNDGDLHDRGTAVRVIIERAGKVPHILKLTKTGQPGHPLYLKGDLRPVPWPL